MDYQKRNIICRLLNIDMVQKNKIKNKRKNYNNNNK